MLAEIKSWVTLLEQSKSKITFFDQNSKAKKLASQAIT